MKKFNIKEDDVINIDKYINERPKIKKEISEFLDIPFQKEALNYQSAQVAKGLGDPLGVEKHQRPVQSSKAKWVSELVEDKEKFAIVAKQLAGITEEDLETWGAPKNNLWDEMDDVST